MAPSSTHAKRLAPAPAPAPAAAAAAASKPVKKSAAPHSARDVPVKQAAKKARTGGSAAGGASGGAAGKQSAARRAHAEDEDDEEVSEDEQEEQMDTAEMTGSEGEDDDGSDDSDEKEEAGDDGVPLASGPRVADKSDPKRVIVVLVRASLETVKTKKGFELLNCDDHQSIHKKLKRDPALSRPDILHQSLLTLLDSPLNKSGRLQIYVQTMNNILIEVSPHIRIPRTYKRFAGLMVQLLHKMKIRASTGNATLLKVIRNPVTQYFPAGARKIGTSVQGKLVDPAQYAKSLPDDAPVIFMFGTHAKGMAEVDWTDETVSFSSFPLSAAGALGKMTSAFESKWGIL